MEITDNKIIEIPQFGFLQGKLTQTKALATLSKKCSYHDKIMHIYEAIESLNINCIVSKKLFHSRKASSGNVEKLCIDDYVSCYKAEVDYFNYIKKGGQKYSDYLSLIKEIEQHNKFIFNEIKAKKEKEEIQRFIEEKEAKIRVAITTTLEEYVNHLTGRAKTKLEKYKSKRQTKSLKEEIDYLESSISHITKVAIETHRVLNNIYQLSGNIIEEKYKYIIGDEVLFQQCGRSIHTTITNTSTNRFGEIVYEVQKVDGIVNKWGGYNDFLPIHFI